MKKALLAVFLVCVLLFFAGCTESYTYRYSVWRPVVERIEIVEIKTEIEIIEGESYAYPEEDIEFIKALDEEEIDQFMRGLNNITFRYPINYQVGYDFPSPTSGICAKIYVTEHPHALNQEAGFILFGETFFIFYTTVGEKAYESRNNFYQYVFAEAKQHFIKAQKYEDKKLLISEEWLKEDQCKKLWHRHCDFCMKTITAEIQEECYCSEDAELWVCAECFNKFQDHFKWTVEKIEDIPANAVNNIMEISIADK